MYSNQTDQFKAKRHLVVVTRTTRQSRHDEWGNFLADCVHPFQESDTCRLTIVSGKLLLESLLESETGIGPEIKDLMEAASTLIMRNFDPDAEEKILAIHLQDKLWNYKVQILSSLAEKDVTIYQYSGNDPDYARIAGAFEGLCSDRSQALVLYRLLFLDRFLKSKKSDLLSLAWDNPDAISGKCLGDLSLVPRYEEAVLDFQKEIQGGTNNRDQVFVRAYNKLREDLDS